MALKLFVDFDGTITRRDVGEQLFRTFGGPVCEELVGRYLSGALGAPECFRGEVAAMGRIPVAAMDALIDRQEIDGTFHGLVGFCALQHIEIWILSDGLDYYIRRILTRHGLADVPFYANAFSLYDEKDDGSARAAIAFPYRDAECTRCACCKRNIMLTRAGEDDIICYAGEGFSDQCPARYADVVFAKDALQTYCREENISYYPYTSFDDVTVRLRVLATRPHLRPRRRAAMNRNAAFMRES